MSTADELRDIGAKHQAARYAGMVAVAARADEKIAALEEALKDAEYFRLLAEYQLEAITWPEGLGQVFHVAAEEPDDQTYALFDIYSGQVWQREMFGTESYWYRADKAGPTTRYHWPLEETSGPYLRLKDDWHIQTLTKAARGADEQRRTIERELRSKPGYLPDDGGPWTHTTLDKGVIGAYRNLQARYGAQGAELYASRREVERLKEALQDAEESTDES